jgi:hypothetical protein
VHYGTGAAIIAGLRRVLTSYLVERGGLVGLGALVVYVAFASPHVVDGDNAEFATLGALGGGAHPSGYPLYVLWLRAWSWLPGGSPGDRDGARDAFEVARSLQPLPDP